MRLSCRLLPLPLIVLALACAPPAATEAPEETSAILTEPAREAIRASIREDIDAGEIAGAVAVVAGPEEELLFESFGVRTVEGSEPMTNDTIFRIYSMTKPITSTAVMMLVERGAIGLDDPVGAYLPELADLGLGVEVPHDDGPTELITEPADRPITIRDLLRHTSGMTYGMFAQSMVDTLYLQSDVLGAADLGAMVTAVSALPLKHHPGVVFEYGISTDMLARVVEVVSEQRFDEFLQEEILGPLGMDDTAFWVPEDKRDRLAGYYRQTESGLVPMDLGEQYITPPTMLSGGGGLVSTAGDYLRFCRMILRGGELDGVRILRPETVALMGTDQLADLPGIDGGNPGGGMVDGFGLGFGVTPEAGTGALPAGTLYWGGYASTAFWIDPTTELVGIYLIQVQPFDMSYGDRFRDLVYEVPAPVEATSQR